MKLKQADVARICKRVFAHEMDITLVAEQFKISRRRDQQLAKQYREDDEIPTVETPGRSAYADCPEDLEFRVVAVHEMLGCGAGAVAHVLRVQDGLTIDNNRVHTILKETIT